VLFTKALGWPGVANAGIVPRNATSLPAGGYLNPSVAVKTSPVASTSVGHQRPPGSFASPPEITTLALHSQESSPLMSTGAYEPAAQDLSYDPQAFPHFLLGPPRDPFADEPHEDKEKIEAEVDSWINYEEASE
jgi:hypothetical protein